MVLICNNEFPSNTEYEKYFEAYQYPLSDFQKHSIQAIVDNNHVLITAQTGSGKTLPAEFAITRFASLKKRVIYTSPIKALTNQKYYEFTQKFPHISFGILTGDIKINPDAQVLLMTLEILMNYLFTNDSDKKESNNLQFQIDINNELGCVVFDEIHYINDQERGQNWENTILMLPDHVQMVMLSATIDNPERFAHWVEKRYTNKQVVLASTPKRIVPLSHYGFLTTTEWVFKGMKDKVLEKEIRDNTNTLILLQNANKEYQENGYIKIAKISKIFDTKRVFMKRKHVLNNLALFLKDRDMLPAIGFVFSRKHVETCANEITTNLLEDDSKIPYTIRRDCEQIIRKLPNFQEYLELPEYNNLVNLLEKGIGIHHSGMIPVLREIVELMISKKYIKILFATESFSIGLDCPIRTSFFVGLTKFDGNNQRLLLSHEYTQMAGRAGRRGIDTVGHVVHLNNLFQLPTQGEYKTMLGGKPQSLVSKFRVSYPLILNLLKNGQTYNFENFIEKSMIFEELKEEIKNHKITVENLRKKVEMKELTIKYLKTPKDICLKYLELRLYKTTAVNKKRKEIERELASFQTQYYNIENDIYIVEGYTECIDAYEQETLRLTYFEKFIQNQIQNVCQVLIKGGFITYNEETQYEFTDLGKIASSITEVHSLILASNLNKWNYLGDFSIKQIIGFLSIFTNIKVPENIRVGIPTTDDLFLKARIQEISDMYRYYEDLENGMYMQTGIKYEGGLNYDIVDFMIEWCNCENEQECKYFIQNRITEKEISIGDFSKAVLKISTIIKELSNIAEQNGNVEFLHKLSKIDTIILKYITTNQSLYV